MIDSIYRISLDINEHGSQAVVKAKMTDTGRKLHITLRAGGMPYTIEDNCYAVFTATKPDGSILYNACTIEGNEIVYEFKEQTCTAVGRCPCEIKLYGLDDKLITSPRFALLVDGTVYPDGRVESRDEFSALTALVSETLEVSKDTKEATENANKAAADAQLAEQRASDAARDADDASTRANAAEQKANTATGSANQAATAATQAAQSANTAAGAARYAADGADEAAITANKATEAANGAANNANQAATMAAQTAKSLMVVGKAAGTAIHLDDAIEQFLVGCRIFGKTTQEATPTIDSPVELVSIGSDGSIDISVVEKNMLNVTATTSTLNGVTFTVSGNGSVTVNGTATDTIFFYLGKVRCAANTGYRLTGCPSGGHDETYRLYIRISDGVYANDIGSGITFTPTEDFESNVVLCIRSGIEVTNLVFYPMVRIASDLDETYKPYKGQLITISTPNGLPGIPVTSGGNHTDASGQQLICDDIDLVRGVRVQRAYRETFAVKDFVKTVLTKTTKYHSPSKYASKGSVKAFCSIMGQDKYSYTAEDAEHWFIDNFFQLFIPNDAITAFETLESVTVVYDLKTPIEIPLSEEELAAYAALHTYRGHTTVSNDASAHMELEYVMDAKKYIDSMISTSGIIPATVE